MVDKKKQAEINDLLRYTQQQVPSFSPQCFLLEKAAAISAAAIDGSIDVSDPGSTSSTKKETPVRQLGLEFNGNKISTNDVQNFSSNLQYIQHITKLQKKNFQQYFKFAPEDIAQMSHFMSITETFTDKEGAVLLEDPVMNTEKNLKDFDDPKQILTAPSTRQAAGIESINVDFVGIDSFTKKQVMLKAKFFFQDIRTMLDDPYAKLFILKTAVGESDDSDKKLFRSLDFHIGWKSSNKKIKSAVENLNLNIRTHLTGYTFDTRQDGSIVVDATYRGYYIEGFAGPQANLLEIAKTRFLEIKQRQDEINAKKISISKRSKKQVNEAALILFVLREARSVIDNAISPAVVKERNMGSRAGVGMSYADWAATYFYTDEGAAKAAVDRIYETIRKNITAQIKASTKKQRLLKIKSTTGADLEKNIIKKQNEIIEPILKKLFSDHTQPMSNYVVKKTTLTSSAELLYADLSHGISTKKKLVDKNLSTSKSNLRNSKKTAFELQLRLAALARLRALQIISEKLVSSGDIKYAKIPRDVVRNFKLGAASASRVDIDAALRALGGNASAYVKDKVKLNSKDFNSENFQIVPFVFLGHLLENILNVPARYIQKGGSGNAVPDSNFTVYDMMKLAGSDVRIDLGYLSYNAPYTGRRINNLLLYYLPISLIDLNNFFNRIVLAKGMIYYSFNDFINDLLNKFVTGVFSSCSKESNTKTLGVPKIETTIGNLPESKKNSSKQKTTQFFIHGGKETINDLIKSGITSRSFGKYNPNLDANIPHFFVFGKTTGIEKNIKLSDIADAQLKSAIYYSPRESLTNDMDGNEQLQRTGFIPAVFKAEVETIGFPLINIGQLIYIDLKPTINPQLAKSRPFDASGYYGIRKVSHTITRDSFTTSISAIIQISDTNREKLSEGIGDVVPLKGGRFVSTSVAANSAWETSSEKAEVHEPETVNVVEPDINYETVRLGGDSTRLTWFRELKKGFENNFDKTFVDALYGDGSTIDGFVDTDPALFEALKPFASATYAGGDISPERVVYFQGLGTDLSKIVSGGVAFGGSFADAGVKSISNLTSSDESFSYSKIVDYLQTSDGGGFEQIDAEIIAGLLASEDERLPRFSGYLIIRQFDEEDEFEIKFVETPDL